MKRYLVIWMVLFSYFRAYSNYVPGHILLPVYFNVVNTLGLTTPEGSTIDFGEQVNGGNTGAITSSAVKFNVSGDRGVHVKVYLGDDDGDDVSLGESLTLTKAGGATIDIIALLSTDRVILDTDGNGSFDVFGRIALDEINAGKDDGEYLGTITLTAIYD